MIEVTDIHKSFDKLQVIKGVSLSIHDGEMLAIVGPSGAGKPRCYRLSALSSVPTAAA